MVKKEDVNILKIDDMSVNLGGKLILDKINLDINEGDMLGIVGVSGAGKTTLLNSITGYYPFKGVVSYYSQRAKMFVPVLDNHDNFKRLFGFSAQNPSFYPELNVIENLEYFASLYNIPENIKMQNIRRALRLVRLEDHNKVLAKNLSGGMKKRLDIACSIVHNPRILILDEPTSDMDPLLRVQIWSLIEDINKNGTTIIVASHFLSEVENVCDRIVFLHNKHIEFIGTPKNFRNLYSKVKEICIATSDGKYGIILKKIIDLPFLEVKHILKKKGRIILHSKENEELISSIISKLLENEKNIFDVEIRDPSMDTLFKLFVEK
ncbi:ABC transporter ATP-binding protein [Candidatus Woesearchaeota archaeon]|nr:ABC transporter ATP-binding protein [Candidatus Woesearchaeota archaeon]